MIVSALFKSRVSVSYSSKLHWFSNLLRGLLFLVSDPKVEVSNMGLNTRSEKHFQKGDKKEHKQQMGLESHEREAQDASKVCKSLLTELRAVLMTFTTPWFQFQVHIKASNTARTRGARTVNYS